MKRDSYRYAARLFRLLSHPARLRILDELRRGEACVCHLQAVLGRPQVYVSQQLRVLREAGVIESYKDGLFVYYRLADSRVERLLGEMLGSVTEAERLSHCTCPFCRGEC
ncbi:MAG: ArsR family transcriptional regulator [Chloroflexi bacterium]|nr:MAG: ArsR family transcriptional regulator [Chloroflexota bacterium]